MRVIAGSLGGRQFASPHSQRTHPMGDKVRGALFNTLGDINGMHFLDAFSGTGALGFEALSRGAGSVLAIESDRAAQRVIDANAASLGLGKKHKLIKASCTAWSDLNQDQQFDIVTADPPFHDLQPAVIVKLGRHVIAGGLFIVNWPGKRTLGQTPPQLEGFERVASKAYGDTQLMFYRRLPAD